MKHTRSTSAEIFASAVCNLNCNYCYIPKLECMPKIQRFLIEKIKDDSYFDFLKELYGTKLKTMHLWGGEPSLFLPYIKGKIHHLKDLFPNLDKIWLSTNFIKSTDIIIDFIKDFPKDIPFEFGIQISTDGDENITDVNRSPGATKQIEENIYKFIKEINKIDLGCLKVSVGTKMTWGSGNFDYLIKENSIKDIFNYFNSISENIDSLSPKFDFLFSPIVQLALPGKYTSSDGKKLACIFNIMDVNGLRDRNAYTRAFEAFTGSLSCYYNKHSNLTCGAGNSFWCVGVNNDIHICHRTLFNNNPEFLEEMSRTENIQGNWNITNFDKDIIAHVNHFFVAENDKDISRTAYTIGGYNYHPFLKTNKTAATIKYMAEIGQVSECYSNIQLATLLSMFIHDCLPCPTEFILNTGSVHLTPISLVRLFGNGAFENLYKGWHENG